MSVAVNQDTKQFSISELLVKIQKLKQDHIDKLGLLSNLMRSNQCSDLDFDELKNELDNDIELLQTYEFEVVNRNYQTVEFNHKDIKVIELIKLKKMLSMKMVIANTIINASAALDSKHIINFSLAEFKKNKSYQDEISKINLVLSNFNNKK